MRSVTRDAKAIAMGLPRVESEIKFWEATRKKAKSVRKRLERLYEARKHLIESPEESESLIQQLRGIQNEGA
jgi:hypothetical protein